jgi:D-alanyl-D-alanine carboxypeptidase
MKLRVTIIALALLAAACTASADTPATVESSPTSAAVDATTTTTAVQPEDLQSIAEQAGRALVYVSDDNGIVSAVAGVGSDGDPLAADDAFFIGSGSKMITAVAVMQLVDQGLVGLDDLLEDYVEFEVATPITVRHLLQHQSGLGDSDAFYDTCDPAEVTAGLAALAASPFNQEPGLVATYSTNGFNMLSYVLSSATSMPTVDVFRQNIFEPLGMTSTFFTGAEEGPTLAMGQNSWDPDCEADQMDIGTGGGFASSAADLDTFMRAVFDGELLSEASLTEMTTVGSQVYGIDYGLGIGVLYPPDGEDQPVYGHWGSMGYDAGAVYDPAANRTIVAVVSRGDFTNAVWKTATWANSS